MSQTDVQFSKPASLPLSQAGAESSTNATDSVPVPLLVPICSWPLGCDRLIEERDMCGFHADKVRDLWAEYEDGD